MPGGHKVVFIGGADTLQLREGGPVHVPGDVVTIPDLQRASLTASGHRFGAVPDVTGEEPPPDAAPDPPPPLEPAFVSASVMPMKPAAPASADKPKEA